MGTEELSAAYDAANEAFHNDPSDENRQAMQDAANKLAAARTEERQQREASAASANDGEGVAQPESVQGSTEVSS